MLNSIGAIIPDSIDLREVIEGALELSSIRNIQAKDSVVVAVGDARVEAQYAFWRELRDQLIAKGYQIDWDDDSILWNVKEYYARKRNRHRWFGFNVDICDVESRTLRFSVEVENNYYFGFRWKGDTVEDVTTPELIEKVNSLGQGYKPSGWWAGWRRSSKNNINFWGMKEDTPVLKRLLDPVQRTALIKDIVTEMCTDIEIMKSKL